MGGVLGSGSGGWLLAWWSSGRERVSQLGSTAESCKKVGSGGVPDVTSLMVKLVWLSILRSSCSIEDRGFYSNDCKAFVPEALILLIAYHTAAPYHAVCGPCGEARAILPTTGGCRPCPSYPC
ncbi:hypothetical protein BHE74_00057924 [Ensete ventricosum]|nr:hypothetical protein BHE74_00057924 [Ensete ventricosum]